MNDLFKYLSLNSASFFGGNLRQFYVVFGFVCIKFVLSSSGKKKQTFPVIDRVASCQDEIFMTQLKITDN